MATIASVADVQRGFEKPIPITLGPKVDEFLGRAYRRLNMLVPKLQTALDKACADSNYNPAEPESDTNVKPMVYGFTQDMIIQAAEVKLRNFGGFSSESAGVFSVTRDDYWATGRIAFDPQDLVLLNEAIDGTFGEDAFGPIRSAVPAYRMP